MQRFSVWELQILIKQKLLEIRKLKLRNVIKEYREDLNLTDGVGMEIIQPQNIFRAESLVHQMKKLIVENAQSLTYFWSTVSTDQSFSRFLEINEKIYQSSREIKLAWRELKKLVPQNIEVASLYCDFLHNCQNDTLKSKEIFVKSYVFNERINRRVVDKVWQSPLTYVFGDDTCCIRISASKENYGKIIEASQNCLRIFGYS